MQNQISLNDVIMVTTELDSWVTSHNWTGYDPYDIKGTRFHLHLAQGQSFPRKVVRKIFNIFCERLPRMTRKAFKIKPVVNSKAMGLFMAAYAILYSVHHKIEYREKAIQCAEWLLRNASSGYSGLCWGYPFDWQSKVFIPKGTPSSVVSAVVGDGFWHLAIITGKKEYYDVCKSICNFFLKDLNIDNITKEIICFSYTPIDDFHVHNANLFVAEFLARVGQKFEIRDYIETSIKAGNYALQEQQDDGSLFYWGLQSHYCIYHRDCYHSGFEIRALWGLWKATGDKRFYELKFFYDSYIKGNGEVWLTPDQKYPADIHACAEAILCPAALYELDKERFNANWPRVFKWIINTMRNHDGSFGYRNFKNRRIDRTPYIRWGQAWIMRALSELIRTLRERN